MKLLYSLLIFSAFLISKTQAQSYQSLFGSDTTFINQIYFCYDILVDNKNSSAIDTGIWMVVLANSDTLIDGNYYKPIGLLDTDSINWEIYGHHYFIREDTNVGQAWIKMYSYNWNTLNDTVINEYLFMDLSLQKGNSFLVAIDTTLIKSLVVDSVYYSNNTKYIHLGGDSLGLLFIEGVGTNTGWWNYCAWDQSLNPWMSCLRSYVKNDTMIYHDTTCYDNFVSTIDIINNFTNTISIFPNPLISTARIEFSNSDHKLAIIEIYNLLGELVHTNTTKSEFIEIYKNERLEGVYVLTVSIDGALIGIEKIIIQ